MLKQLLTCFLICCAGNQAWAQAYSYEKPRKLKPGVITVIRDANIDDAVVEETREFTELLATVQPPDWNPNFDPKTETLLEKAKRVSFQREIWTLEFGFKPLRVINVGGRPVWYLVYYVKNNGDIRVPVKKVSTIDIESKDKPIRCVPSFVLQAHDRKRASRDTLRPDVVSRIAAKERVTRGALHDSASITRMPIPVSTPTADRRVWGVATWDNVDARADFISVFVHGLTNAYSWEPPEGGYRANSGEQDVVRSKALQLNFWRGGDGEDLHDNEMLFGIPLYPNDPKRQANVLKTYQIDKPERHRWVYR